jgi:AraC family transcriptional regulator of adaptative response/methylated-DNA-[protein]-cysteine methyltransferase
LARVVAFLEAPHEGLDLPLDIRGSAQEQAIWRALRNVPPGQTVTYGQIANGLPLSATAQDVGAACAALCRADRLAGLLVSLIWILVH